MSIPYEQYYEHALALNENERVLQSIIVPQLPDLIVDTHVHAGAPEHFSEITIPDHVRTHMMSTFPVTTIEMSRNIDATLLPGQDIQKLRFAHAFTGIAHRAVNQYLLSNSPNTDRVALFGVSNNAEDVIYTREHLRSGAYAGLKMYYNASNPPKEEMDEYFPPEILDVAEDERIPIILHLPKSLYRSAEEVEMAAARNPELKIVLAHIGVAHVVRPELDGILHRFAAAGNVYVDTSGVDSAELVLKAMQHLGPDRVMYGSDEPLNLIRSVVYDNPDVGPRLLVDHDYHWADRQEQARWRHLADKPFVHNQWRQLQAILDAVDMFAARSSDKTRLLEKIFHGNAQSVFGFSKAKDRAT
jgi:predicted TIM-barrel fold metal-dependent hydrolase